MLNVKFSREQIAPVLRQVIEHNCPLAIIKEDGLIIMPFKPGLKDAVILRPLDMTSGVELSTPYVDEALGYSDLLEKLEMREVAEKFLNEPEWQTFVIDISEQDIAVNLTTETLGADNHSTPKPAGM